MDFSSQLRRDFVISRFEESFAKFSPVLRDGGVLQKIRKACLEERFTIVVGAGVSRTVGLPCWADLVAKLISRGFPNDGVAAVSAREFLLEASADPLRQVEVLGDILEFKSNLFDLLRECLYESYDQSAEGVLLEPICGALSSDGFGRTSSVITYNFDNTLEMCLSRLGMLATPVHSDAQYANSRNGIRVFHPHGYIPLFPNSDDSEHLVLGEREYYTQYTELTSWANVVQMHHFRSRRCLFVGLSLEDPNLRRLLSQQRNARTTEGHLRHFAVQRLSGSAAKNYFTSRQLSVLGVEVLWVRDYAELGDVFRECFTH